jgi:hypothetical protein
MRNKRLPAPHDGPDEARAGGFLNRLGAQGDQRRVLCLQQLVVRSPGREASVMPSGATIPQDQIAQKRGARTRRPRLGLSASALAITLLVALPSSAANAAAKTAPPITSQQICAKFPAQIVAKELGKHTQPAVSAGYSKKLTSVDFAVYCSFRFSAASVLNIVFYGPADPLAEAAGSKVPALGPTGRLLVSTPPFPSTTFVYWLSHGYRIGIGGPTAFSHASLIALALYITQHLP